MIIRSKAKVNLFLKVYGKNTHYHLLHSLVAFCDDIYDEFDINEAENNEIESTPSEFSKFVPNESNILWKVFEFLASEKKFSIKLKKNIPVAAGLGGGSSNAAVALNYLLKILPKQTLSSDFSLLVKTLGSDVPVCLNQKSAYIASFGEEIKETSLPSGIWAVLVNPKLAIKTAEVFKNFCLSENTYIQKSPNFKNADELFSYLKSLNNDLEAVTIKILPEVSVILNAIAKTQNCILARMSGSGATCFGLFNSEIDAIKARKQLKKINQNWWIKETLLV
jgi:4-diphosphocytidyl-2-C-methyl-D-erythritol kinase